MLGGLGESVAILAQAVQGKPCLPARLDRIMADLQSVFALLDSVDLRRAEKEFLRRRALELVLAPQQQLLLQQNRHGIACDESNVGGSDLIYVKTLVL